MKNLYCTSCKKVIAHIPKLDALKNNKMVCGECSHENSYCNLLKPDDKNFLRTSNTFRFIEWNDEGLFKNEYVKPNINLSLIMGPLNSAHAWLTTEITEILEENENHVKFKTKNSLYELYYYEPYKFNENV